jgi:hypothetical protein
VRAERRAMDAERRFVRVVLVAGKHVFAVTPNSTTKLDCWEGNH